MKAANGGIAKWPAVVRASVVASSIRFILEAGAAQAACTLDGGHHHIAVAVLDGATLRLETGATVRLLGYHPPRAADVGASGEWPPEQAARAALANMALNKPIELRFDRHRRDRHGRTLAHVYVRQPRTSLHGDPHDRSADWLQARLLADGHGRTMLSSDNANCATELLEHEQQARRSRRGIWAHPAYRLRDARHIGSLALAHGTFQIATGTINGVRRRGEHTELQLAMIPYRRTIFRFRHDNRAILGALEGDPARLKGQTVEVRGWVLREQGADGNRRDVVIDATVQGWVTVQRPEPVESAGPPPQSHD